jgi:hypothetical protein
VKRGSGETRNIKTEAILAKIGVGNTVGVAVKCFFTLSDVNTSMTAMKTK